MSVPDRLDFSTEKIFKTVCENLTKTDGKTKNWIDCKDDIVFVWDREGHRLLTQNLKIKNHGAPVYQELFPTDPPLCDVQFLRVNSIISKAALWGPNGVAVLDIPQRWGSQGAFQGGKPVIITRCGSVEDRFFSVHDVEVRQARFHPGSVKDNHLLVLTSDNNFRLYQLAEGEKSTSGSGCAFLLRVWSLGQHPLNLSGKRLPFLASLGDTAVDFDFAPPVVDESRYDSDREPTPEEVIWRAVVLRGNGDVCTLDTSLLSEQKPRLEGPLAMYPPADDNYGVDACSILVLPTLPVTIVVATCAGTLYHCVMLDSFLDNKSALPNSTHGLYVLESVELELGIQLNDDDSSYTCPVLLHRDPVSRWKYYCTHNTGIHAVSTNFALELENFVEQSSSENLRLDQPSTVEYLVCTRTSLTPASPVLGLTILSSWSIVLALLSNGDVVSLPLKIIDVGRSFGFITDENVGEDVSPMKKLLQEPFELHIRNLLKRNVNMPILKLNKNHELSPQEYLDLITRTTNILRQEYFAKFELVRDEVEQRIATLNALKRLQMHELQQLEAEKVSLQDTAEKLAEKYEEIKDKQQLLTRAVENIVIAVMKMEPVESIAEKKMKNELICIEDQLEHYEKSIKQLKEKIDYQRFKIEKHKLGKKVEEIHLGENQISTIKRNLIVNSQDIAELVNYVNAIKKQLNILDS